MPCHNFSVETNLIRHKGTGDTRPISKTVARLHKYNNFIHFKASKTMAHETVRNTSVCQGFLEEKKKKKKTSKSLRVLLIYSPATCQQRWQVITVVFIFEFGKPSHAATCCWRKTSDKELRMRHRERVPVSWCSSPLLLINPIPSIHETFMLLKWIQSLFIYSFALISCNEYQLILCFDYKKMHTLLHQYTNNKQTKSA